MPRTRTWYTKHATEGSTTTLPRVDPLIDPARIVPGMTVVRIVGGLEVLANYDASVTRPILLRAGIVAGPQPAATILDVPDIETTEWLWIGSEQLTPITVGTTNALVTHPAGTLATITTKARRRLALGENVWLVTAALLTAGTDFNGFQLLTRTLWLDPEV